MDKFEGFITELKNHWILTGEDVRDLSEPQWQKIGLPIGIENRLKRLTRNVRVQLN